nr:MAG TPA: hypothetical protein [Caudoviricetes sp.]
MKRRVIRLDVPSSEHLEHIRTALVPAFQILEPSGWYHQIKKELPIITQWMRAVIHRFSKLKLNSLMTMQLRCVNKVNLSNWQLNKILILRRTCRFPRPISICQIKKF